MGDVFKPLVEDLEHNSDGWSEWLDLPQPEEVGTLPGGGGPIVGDWERNLSSMQRLLLLRAMRPDRVTTAMSMFISATLGARYIEQPPFSMRETFDDSSAPTPLFFVLFPGVDPGADIEMLGAELGFTEAEGKCVPISMASTPPLTHPSHTPLTHPSHTPLSHTPLSHLHPSHTPLSHLHPPIRYVSISMGQGQEANAEACLDRFTEQGGWVFLQNVRLTQSEP